MADKTLHPVQSDLHNGEISGVVEWSMSDEV